MGLFGRAKNLIQGLGSPPERKVQYYNVVCPMGHRVRGQRTEGYQAIRCPACGEGAFVLAASPLPEPSAPAQAASRHPAAAMSSRVVDEGPIELHDPGEATVEIAEDRPNSDDEIIWEDQEAAEVGSVADGETSAPGSRSGPVHVEPPRQRPPQARRRPSVLDEGRRIPESKARDARQDAVDRRLAIDAESRVGRRPNKRPLVVFGIVVLVVVGTVVLRTWRNHRQAFPQVAELGRVEGIPALEAGDFDKAYQLLSAAKRAVDGLGGAVEDADKIRQAADEAVIFVNLASESLEGLLDQAARTNPESWAVRFDNQYQGRAVILDSMIKATPDSPEKRFEIEYVVMPLGEAANFRGLGGARPERTARIDFDGFELFQLAQPKVGDHVLFGARLAGFQFDAGSNSWVIRLQPKSGVFIHYNKALEALGWPLAAENASEPGRL